MQRRYQCTPYGLRLDHAAGDRHEVVGDSLYSEYLPNPFGPTQVSHVGGTSPFKFTDEPLVLVLVGNDRRQAIALLASVLALELSAVASDPAL